MEVNPLIPIGVKIKVDKSKIENLLSSKVLDDLPQIVNGEIIDYKMTDGMGIGYVLMTENNLKIWIFNNELDEQTKKEYKIDDITKSTNMLTLGPSSSIFKINYELNGNRSIKSVLNPINLISWLIFTLKDTF